ncbi:MAG: hypothetical protein H0X66_07235 [Verrucomicrobia bacterium]|nr:hypothetical protein [Verrucomicrobiota bacterium]
MKIDKLKQFVALRQSLLTEKAQLETRLAQINKALGEETGTTKTATPAPARASASPQVTNPMSLKAAVRKVTSARSLTKKEILQAIGKLGYRFSAKDPMNSLNVVLYTKGQFKNDSGKFSPAK